jgi:Tat protein translocase TatB subunit
VFNLGMGEITVILLLALIFLGPKKLPEMAAGLGRLIRQIRKTTADVKNEIVLDDAIRKPFEDLRDAVTLHPDELKRRDEIKKSLEEARRRMEEAEAEAAAAAAANAPPEAPPSPDGDGGDAAPDPAAMAEAPDVPAPPIPPPVAVHPPRMPTPPPGVPSQPPQIPPPPPSFRPTAPPAGTVARRPTPPPVPPPPRPPRVTPPISSLNGDAANITQVLAEEDLLPPNRGAAPPPLPPPLPGVAPPSPPPAPNKKS